MSHKIEFTNTNFLGQLQFSKNIQSNSKQEKIRILTVPKSGSHLLEKIFLQLGFIKNETFSWTHVPAHRNAYKTCPNKNIIQYKGLFNDKLLREKAVIVIRDPRDNLSSLANHFKSGKGYTYNLFPSEKAKSDYLGKLTSSELLTQIINLNPTDILFPRWYAQYHIYDNTIKSLLNKPKQYLVIRFEDLLPSNQGQGNQTNQVSTIKKILHFFKHHNISDQAIESALKDSWGGTFTFTQRTNKIGQWKATFTPEQIELFAKKWNPFLLALGYETDPNWHLEMQNGQNEASKAV